MTFSLLQQYKDPLLANVMLRRRSTVDKPRFRTLCAQRNQIECDFSTLMTTTLSLLPAQ